MRHNKSHGSLLYCGINKRNISITITKETAYSDYKDATVNSKRSWGASHLISVRFLICFYGISGMRLGRYKQDMTLHVPTCTKQINWEFKQDIGLHVNAICDEKVQQLPPNWFIKSKATERVEYVRKEEVKMTEKRRRVRREDEKKSSIENHIEIPRVFGLQQRFWGQHHTSNETATHATVSTPHKYPGIFMFSFILIKARNVCHHS